MFKDLVHTGLFGPSVCGGVCLWVQSKLHTVGVTVSVSCLLMTAVQ